jgi:metal-responsive CopG/Arc/MetJ family transcriptional regulator
MSHKFKRKRHLGISIDKDLLDEIERQRGLVKRSTFVNYLLRKSIHARMRQIERETATGVIRGA